MKEKTLISFGASAMKEVIAVFALLGGSGDRESGGARRIFCRIMLEWTSSSIPTLSL
jgi:hypothetical protein